MFTTTVNTHAALTNESKTNLKMEATNGVITGLHDDQILHVGDPASGLSKQIVPNAFVGSSGTYDFILSSVGYEGAATDESGNVIKDDNADFKVKGKVKYVTTRGPFKVTTTQQISLKIDTSHDKGDTRVLAGFTGDHTTGNVLDVSVVSSYLTKASSRYDKLKKMVLSEDSEIRLESRDSLSLDEFDKVLAIKKQEVETV
jgi:hypothetical protein